MTKVSNDVIVPSELTGIFKKRATNFYEGRTRKAIEDNIIRLLKELHCDHFKTIGSGYFDITVEHEGMISLFRFKAFDTTGKKIKDYDAWSIRINIAPFIRNYDEWMKGGNDEWKQHVKPYSR